MQPLSCGPLASYRRPPCIRQPAPERVGSPRPAPAVRPGVGPVETSILVFVVEDEEPIRDLLEAVLKEGGFAVATAGAGEDAIQMLEAPETQYRALVTDVNLSPGKLTGWDVAKRARELQP